MADWGNRGGAAAGAGGSYGESQAASKASDNIRQIQNLTKILNKWVKQVGTSKDNQQLRENMYVARSKPLYPELTTLFVSPPFSPPPPLRQTIGSNSAILPWLWPRIRKVSSTSWETLSPAAAAET